MNGLNPEPCSSYRLADRFVCDKCGESPAIKKADTDGMMVTVTLSCHGETVTKTIEKKELVFLQRVFSEGT
jgi:hypothetical protein